MYLVESTGCDGGSGRHNPKTCVFCLLLAVLLYPPSSGCPFLSGMGDSKGSTLSFIEYMR